MEINKLVISRLCQVFFASICESGTARSTLKWASTQLYTWKSGGEGLFDQASHTHSQGLACNQKAFVQMSSEYIVYVDET